MRAQSLLEAACVRSEPLRLEAACARSERRRACSWPPVRAQSLLEVACALEIDAAVRACSASPLRLNVLFNDARRCYTELCISSLGSVCFRECILRVHTCICRYCIKGPIALALFAECTSQGNAPDILKNMANMAIIMHIFEDLPNPPKPLCKDQQCAWPLMNRRELHRAP